MAKKKSENDKPQRTLMIEKFQITNPKFQISSNDQNFNDQNKENSCHLEGQSYQFPFYNCFVYLVIACLFGRQGIWNLFGIWSLGVGIYKNM